MKKLALLLALVPSVALASPTGPKSVGRNVTIRNASIAEIAKHGTVELPAGKELIVDHAAWGAVSNSAIKDIEISPAGAATLTTTPLKAAPAGAIGWGGVEKSTFKATGSQSFDVTFTNGMGQKATLKVQPTATNVAPAAATK